MAGINERYASALFSIAIEEGALEKYIEQAVFVRETLGNGECLRVLEHPHIPETEKRGLIAGLFGDSLPDGLKGFLYLLIAKSRENLSIPVLTAFLELANRFKGKTTAAVVSAADLTETQLQRIKLTLSKKLNKKVEIASRTDTSLIGGFYVLVDGFLMDRTLKHRLNEMKSHLKTL